MNLGPFVLFLVSANTIWICYCNCFCCCCCCCCCFSFVILNKIYLEMASSRSVCNVYVRFSFSSPLFRIPHWISLRIHVKRMVARNLPSKFSISLFIYHRFFVLFSIFHVEQKKAVKQRKKKKLATSVGRFGQFAYILDKPLCYDVRGEWQIGISYNSRYY